MEAVVKQVVQECFVSSPDSSWEFFKQPGMAWHGISIETQKDPSESKVPKLRRTDVTLG